VSEHVPESAPPPVLAPPEQRTGMMLAHLLGLFLLLGLLPGTIATLMYWLIVKDNASKPFVQEQAKEALNFQISVLLAWIIVFLASLMLSVVLIGFFGFTLLPFLLLASLIFSIVAAVKANNGECYRYPLNFRFIR